MSDEGAGISPGDLPRIFDRFTQIDQSSTRAHGGVGLGLHLVRELTRRFGGEVAVDSVGGPGTTFTVTIPVPGIRSARIRNTRDDVRLSRLVRTDGNRVVR